MKNKKTLLGLLLIVVMLLSTALFVSCKKEENPDTGKGEIYYLYENGELNKSNFIQLKDSKWSDDDNENGTYVVSGTSITIYVEIMGEKEEYAKGTLKDGVLTLTIMGTEITYCKEGKTPSVTPAEKNKVMVLFDANGGQFENGNKTLSFEVKEGEKLNIPSNPTKNGYLFTQWYKNSSLDDVWDFENDTVMASCTLYAGWEVAIKEYNVTFVLNYSEAESVVYPTVNGLVTYIPTRQGYIFNGWWISGGQTENGLYILTQKWNNIEIVTQDNLVLYAEWVEESIESKQLMAPSVNINGNVFSWLKIDNAIRYDVRVYKSGINTEVVSDSVTETSWTFSDDLTCGYYIIKIRAIGDGINTVNSVYVSKNYSHHVLNSISEIDFDISTSILTWADVEFATAYDLYIGDKFVANLESAIYDLSSLEAGIYDIKVVAKRSSWQSSMSTKKIVKKRLKTPDQFRFYVDNDSKYTIVWSEVAYADLYIVVIGDERIQLTTAIYEIDSSSKYWNDQLVSIKIQAFDSEANYLISNLTEEINLGKIYSLIIDADENNAGEVVIEGNMYVPQECVVTFNYGDSTEQKIIKTGERISLPNMKYKGGGDKVFRGWFTDSECTKIYDASLEINGDLNLYAGWFLTGHSSNAQRIIDITSENNTSSKELLGHVGNHTQSPNYRTYFSISEDGEYTVYYRKVNGRSSTEGISFIINNLTKKEQILELQNVYSYSYLSVTFYASAGDVICIYTNVAKNLDNCVYGLYVQKNTAYTEKGMVKKFVATTESSLSSVYVGYGEKVTITAKISDDRYVFMGWYDGDILLSTDLSYTFTMPQGSVRYTAKWRESV